MLKLYKRQGGRDVYTGKHIKKQKLFDGTYVQVDHIQPISISWNNSYHNLTLTFTRCNQNKGERTPLQWMKDTSQNISKFYTRVHKMFPLKINNKAEPWNFAIEHNYLTLHCVSGKEKWASSSLPITATESVVLYKFLRKHMHYSPSLLFKKQHTFLSNGRATAFLRKVWHINNYKYMIDKNGNKQRFSDKNHAIDAFVIAQCTPKLLHKVCQFYKYYSKTNNKLQFPLPCNNFNGFMKKLYQNITVRRIEPKHKHQPLTKDTKYSAKYWKYGLIMKRLPVSKIKYTHKKGLYVNNGWKIMTKIGKHTIYNPQFIDSIKEYLSHKAFLKNKIKVLKNNYKKSKDKHIKKNIKTNRKALKSLKCFNNNRCSINKIKVFTKIKNTNKYLFSTDKKSVYTASGVLRVDFYKKKNKFYEVYQYPYNIITHHEASQIETGSKKAPQYVDKSYQYVLSLYPNKFNPIKIILKKPIIMKVGDRKLKNIRSFTGYLRRFATTALLVQPFDYTSKGGQKNLGRIALNNIKRIYKLLPNDYFGESYQIL